jgi:hypothetical protein
MGEKIIGEWRHGSTGMTNHESSAAAFVIPIPRDHVHAAGDEGWPAGLVEMCRARGPLFPRHILPGTEAFRGDAADPATSFPSSRISSPSGNRGRSSADYPLELAEQSTNGRGFSIAVLSENRLQKENAKNETDDQTSIHHRIGGGGAGSRTRRLHRP